MSEETAPEETAPEAPAAEESAETTTETEQPKTEQLAPTFAELGVRPEIVAALADEGIERTFPIQAQTLPLALEGGDVIGQAKTGTGKTLGFGIPLLQRILVPADGESNGKPQALIVVPTRELAIQVGKDLAEAGRDLKVRVLTIYGGRAYEPQIDALTKGIDIVVGTPGRLIDLVQQRHLDLSQVGVLVLDEADEMLDMGFLPDVEKIVAKVPAERQTMLFSATMPGQIVALARRYMNKPMHIRAADAGDESATVDAIEQHVWRAHPMDKMEIIARVLQSKDRGLTMIFTRTKRRAQRIQDELSDRGFAAASVHGDLGQGAREQALRAFRNGKVDVLAATDVAARGIDVDGVTHVINYECPDDEKTYVHRIGRTGRAGESGVAVTLVDWEDLARWAMIDRALKLPFANPIETYSTSEHIYTGLGIPAEATGRLPRADRTRAGLEAEELEDLGETGKSRGGGGQRGGGQRDERRSQRGGGSGRRRDQDRSGNRDRDNGNDTQRQDNDRPRRQRQRRRTRSADSGGSPAGNTTDATAGPATDVPTGSDVSEVRPRRSRNRRRRRSSGSGTQPPTGE
ncbi:MAG: DEAD/DEAH box helicase [Candidatus Nanopelagicales bacterium]